MKGLTAKNKCFWSLLTLPLSVASIRSKWFKPLIQKKVASMTIKIQKDVTFNSDCKKINLIPNKSFRYYNQ